MGQWGLMVQWWLCLDYEMTGAFLHKVKARLNHAVIKGSRREETVKSLETWAQNWPSQIIHQLRLEGRDINSSAWWEQLQRSGDNIFFKLPHQGTF